MDAVVQLHDASGRGNVAGVEDALRSGANVDARTDVYHETALQASSRHGHFAIVCVLLDAGADKEARNLVGWTPLQSACAGGRLEVVRELVRRGADIYTKDRFGSTPFDCSVQSNHPAVTEFLLEHYRQQIFENEGRRSLPTVLKQGNYRDVSLGLVVLKLGTVITDELLSILGYFVEQNPDCIRERDNNGDLPIHIACRKHAPFQAIQYLVEQDPATLHISNNDGALPIHLACQSGASLQAIKHLVEDNGGAGTLCARDSNGNLPLHVLCGSTESTLETIEYLTKAHPAALWTGNSYGVLPLHSLCETPSPLLKAVECLIKPYPAALSTRTSNGDLPTTLAGRSASLSVIYTLVRGDPQVISSD